MIIECIYFHDKCWLFLLFLMKNWHPFTLRIDIWWCYLLCHITAPDKLFVELAVQPYGQLTAYLIVPNIEIPTTKSTTNLALLWVIFPYDQRRPLFSRIMTNVQPMTTCNQHTTKELWPTYNQRRPMYNQYVRGATKIRPRTQLTNHTTKIYYN